MVSLDGTTSRLHPVLGVCEVLPIVIKSLNEWFGYEAKDFKEFLEEFEAEYPYHERLTELLKFIIFMERKYNNETKRP